MGRRRPYAQEEERMPNEMDEVEELSAFIGRRFAAVGLSPDRRRLTFHASDGQANLTLRADGDCYSTSWIEHLEGAEEILGQPIRKVERAYVGEYMLGSCSYRKLYFYRFSTEEGSATIELRNDSNGYYGGSLELE